ncbi:MAG: DinB family protein [SAR202 cluster bacterium]|nr:DinB family protein [SAR202 cluster bacterium]
MGPGRDGHTHPPLRRRQESLRHVRKPRRQRRQGGAERVTLRGYLKVRHPKVPRRWSLGRRYDCGGAAAITPDERTRKLESYRDAYGRLVDGLKQFPRDIWQFRDAHGCWSIHELVVHITDSEANSYVRCRRLIAESGETLMAYDENAWATSLDYHDQNPDEALELFRLLRHRTYTIIESLPEETWSHTAHHPENGNMTLDDWLETYESHVPEHLQHMRENYDAWMAQDNSG